MCLFHLRNSHFISQWFFHKHSIWMFILTVHIEMSDYLSVCMSVCFLGTFCIMHMRYSCRKTIKNNKNPNKQPTFRCQPAFRCQPDFGSHSQLLTNKLFSSFFFMRLTWASRAHDGKGTFFMIFECFSLFSTMRTHACGQNTQQTTVGKNPHIQVSESINKLECACFFITLCLF